MKSIETKLAEFAAKVEADQIQNLHNSKLACEANLINAKTSVKIGAKYARIDIGYSGRYMVEISTQEIYGIKAYGVIHRGHRFGTLDTIGEYFWGDYRAIKLNAAKPTVTIKAPVATVVKSENTFAFAIGALALN